LYPQNKVVHEDITDGRDAEFSRAKKALGEAQRIFFPGFGFGEKNVGRLGIAELPVARASATAYSMTSAEIQTISQMCHGTVQFDDSDCLDFCRRIAIWS
jgi:hypothetical protein